jgi:hypothetical protein
MLSCSKCFFYLKSKRLFKRILFVGAAHFWLAMPAYVIDLAKSYAQATDTLDQDRVTFFFGIVYAAIYTSKYINIIIMMKLRITK